MDFFFDPKVIINAFVFLITVLLIILLSIQFTLNQILKILREIKQKGCSSREKEYAPRRRGEWEEN